MLRALALVVAFLAGGAVAVAAVTVYVIGAGGRASA